MRQTRVLVVDDSALVRRTVRALIEQDTRFVVCGQARDGVEAIQLAERLAPDVVTLDLDMPGMDGLAALPRLINDLRQRVLILSTLATASSYPTFKALALGAVDFITKPGAGAYLHNLDELGAELRRKLEVVARVSPDRIRRVTASSPPKATGHGPAPLPSPVAFPYRRPEVIVGVGGSTGGTTPLETILGMLPASLPATLVVVQHLPVGFSLAFARYLATLCPFSVEEAHDGMLVRSGVVYLAPGGGHLRVQYAEGELQLRIDPLGRPLHGYRPSIDALFYSLALAARSRAAGVLLSGMGSDGANGLAAIRSLGGRTMAQDLDTCVVPEMPRRAVALGAAQHVGPATEIAATVSRLAARREVTWTHVS